MHAKSGQDEGMRVNLLFPHYFVPYLNREAKRGRGLDTMLVKVKCKDEARGS